MLASCQWCEASRVCWLLVDTAACISPAGPARSTTMVRGRRCLAHLSSAERCGCLEYEVATCYGVGNPALDLRKTLCPLLAQSGHPLLHRICALMTQSGHPKSTASAARCPQGAKADGPNVGFWPLADIHRSAITASRIPTTAIPPP